MKAERRIGKDWPWGEGEGGLRIRGSERGWGAGKGVAAVTDCHNLGLKQQKCILSQLWRSEV